MPIQNQQGNYTAEFRVRAVKMVTEVGLTTKITAAQYACRVPADRRCAYHYIRCE